MTAWIAIIISVLALLVNIVSQLDKLLSVIDDFKAWRTEKTRRYKALKTIEEITATEKYNSRKITPQLSPIAFYTPLFFLSVISSAILSRDASQTSIVMSALTYFFISLFAVIVFLLISRRFKRKYFFPLFLAIALFGMLWGAFVVVVEMAGLRMMWSGIVAGMLLTIFTWITGERTRS